MYYGQMGKTLILLLCGGDKSTQAKDIETAHAYWRETLYRTLSERGNPRLDTLAVILAAFGLRLTVRPARKSRARRIEPLPALA